MATSAVAGPSSWKAIRYGQDETKKDVPGTVAGNARVMEVIANAVSTYIQVFAMSDPLCPSEDGAGSDMDTVWYELTFVGDKTATNHTWSIETDINGEGTAEAESHFQGTAIGQSLQTIWVTGNHKNGAAATLGVADTSGIGFSLKPPEGVDITLADSVLSVGTDTFTVLKPKKTVGAGKKCRIRIDSSAEAQAKAKTYLGHVSVLISGTLRVDLEMKGTCTVGGIRVEDRFRIGCAGPTVAKTRPPTGGIEGKSGTPTDTLEEELEEEEEEKKEEEKPAVDGTDEDDSPSNDLDPDDVTGESTGGVDSSAIME